MASSTTSSSAATTTTTTATATITLTTTTPTLPHLPLELLHLITTPSNVSLSSLSSLTRTCRLLHALLIPTLLSRGLRAHPPPHPPPASGWLKSRVPGPGGVRDKDGDGDGGDGEPGPKPLPHGDTLLHWSVRRGLVEGFVRLVGLVREMEGEDGDGEEEKEEYESSGSSEGDSGDDGGAGEEGEGEEEEKGKMEGGAGKNQWAQHYASLLWSRNKLQETVLHIAAGLERDAGLEIVRILIEDLERRRRKQQEKTRRKQRRESRRRKKAEGGGGGSGGNRAMLRRSRSLDDDWASRLRQQDSMTENEDSNSGPDKPKTSTHACPGAPLCATTRDSFTTALYLSVGSRSPEVTRLLVSAGACVRHCGGWGYPASLTAAGNGDISILSTLLRKHLSSTSNHSTAHQPAAGDLTMLHIAAAYARVETLRWLVTEAGEDVHARDYRGVTPLRYAEVAMERVYGGVKPSPLRSEAVKVLVEELGASEGDGLRVSEEVWLPSQSDLLHFVKEPPEGRDDVERRRAADEGKRREQERMEALRKLDRRMCGKLRRGAEKFWVEFDW